MEFLEYLDRTEVEIIKIIEKAGYKTEENNHLCLLSDDYVGFLDKRKKIMQRLQALEKNKRQRNSARGRRQS